MVPCWLNCFIILLLIEWNQLTEYHIDHTKLLIYVAVFEGLSCWEGGMTTLQFLYSIFSASPSHSEFHKKQITTKQTYSKLAVHEDVYNGETVK